MMKAECSADGSRFSYLPYLVVGGVAVVGLLFLAVPSRAATPGTDHAVATPVCEACCDGECHVTCPEGGGWTKGYNCGVICGVNCEAGGYDEDTGQEDPGNEDGDPITDGGNDGDQDEGGDSGQPPPGPPPVPGPTATPTCYQWRASNEYMEHCTYPAPLPPTPTPPPQWSDEFVTVRCQHPWNDCDSTYAEVTYTFNPNKERVDGQGYIIDDFKCLPREECEWEGSAGPSDPGPPTYRHPCEPDDEFWTEGPDMRQVCTSWPGYDLQVIAHIPPHSVLMNPWPRCLVGLETRFWAQAPKEYTVWSAGTALPCAVDGGRHSSSTYNCGGRVGRVGEGSKVNIRLGLAWRRWTYGTGSLLGEQPPPAEFVWTVPDREWNGGDVTYQGNFVGHTFESSSYGLDTIGPAWNPECQDRDCDCDRRLLANLSGDEADWLAAEAYKVTLRTYWWPEYTFEYDRYECVDPNPWGGCRCQGACLGCTRQACSGCGPCPDGESCWRDFQCQEYAWVHHTDPMDYCPDGRRRGDWCMYDLRDFGLGYFYAVSTGNVVAGADPAGARCGSWIDKYPCYVPVPCIEVQPVAPGSGE